ncbi:phenylalanine--tRNA ligase subunit alpha [bacterium]|nr:MAG: phenylalanine--tRNA ligase subunit alpha [bacterium]QQR61867.1 MAG: phenylalanine--tRNA ligase subunit alpha [bacterium]QQR62552.1 MAG: phenylalanine--tRNA ligase subunit alpha [bacterium]
MDNLKTTTREIEEKLHIELAAVTTVEMIEHIHTQFLGRKGLVGQLNEQLKNCTVEQKRVFGPLIQQLRLQAEMAINQKRELIQTAERQNAVEKNRYFDVTLERNEGRLAGSLHPITLAQQEIEDIFAQLGFLIERGPEVETDFYNFEALNIDKDHPARDAHDTFWLNLPNRLLRTHTSNAQIHTMTKQKPPLAIVSTGRVFRNEATDASHDFQFFQCEALLIDQQVSVANLLYIIRHMLRSFFQHDALEIRVRPGYFPFVEPGLEVDASCPFCKDGCSVCKKTGWIELGGAGLVHPNVLRACSIDPEAYSGCAFGFGLSRLVMLKYGINDVRYLHSPKIEILSQCNRLIL